MRRWQERLYLKKLLEKGLRQDTNGLGQGKQYSTLKVKSRPYIFPAFSFNHSYEDCDFFVSVAKMKNHEELGITLSMKNLFGITPELLYGQVPKPPDAVESSVGNFSPWVRERVFDRWDGRYRYLGNRGREFYFETTAGAPRGRVVAVDLDRPQPEQWRTVVAEAPEAIDSARYVGGQFVVAYLRDAHSALKVYGADGGDGAELALPGIGQVAGLNGRGRDAEAFFAYTDFLTPHHLLLRLLLHERHPRHLPVLHRHRLRSVTARMPRFLRDRT